jgi:hypothetical protein
MASQQDVEFFSGNDIFFDASFVSEADGEPIDLSGAQRLTYALSKKPNGTAIISKEIGSSLVIVNAPLGYVHVFLSAAETEPLSGEYYHEMRLVNSLGKKVTVMYGAVNVLTNLIRD